VNRVWLNWDEPYIAAAAAWLLDGARCEGAVRDLRHVVCLTPGRRAGRMLLSELIRRCEQDAQVLAPPRLLTPGALGEVLLGGETPNARRTERGHAWMRALREHDRCALTPLLPRPPDADDDLAWHGLARRIETLHRELAGELVTFEAMAGHADELLMHHEADRWRVLAALHDRYREVLAAAGRGDPEEAAARALDGGAIDADVHVVLAGITDLNALQRRIVTALGDRASALVQAPESMSDRFDELGCVCPDAWATAQIIVDDDQLVVADRPSDQAQAALAELARLVPAPAAHEVTIGLGDEALVASFQSAGQWAGIRFHHASGHPLAGTAVMRLLAAIADWLEDESIAPLAALLRHGDFEVWLDAAQPGLTPSSLLKKSRAARARPDSTDQGAESMAYRRDTSRFGDAELARSPRDFFNGLLWRSPISTGTPPSTRALAASTVGGTTRARTSRRDCVN